MSREFSPAVRQAVRYRAGGMCEICHLEPIVHFHHILMRSQGGDGSIDNVLGLDHKCHAYVHENPALAFANGWLRHAAPVNMGLKS